MEVVAVDESAVHIEENSRPESRTHAGGSSRRFLAAALSPVR
jgi:hypothetical protein